MPEPARIAIDLGAESCRISLLRWKGDQPEIELIHRIPNGPVHRSRWLCWPLDTILAGLEEGLRKAAQAAPEGIASIAVDSWSVDYVRLSPAGQPLREPFCYRDERTVPTKSAADAITRVPQRLPASRSTVENIAAPKASISPTMASRKRTQTCESPSQERDASAGCGIFDVLWEITESWGNAHTSIGRRRDKWK